MARGRRRRGRGDGCGGGGASGIGGRRETGPTGGPHLSATLREEAAGRPGWASACGRPSKEEGRKEGMARRPIRKKEEKGREKKKKKKKKDFPWN